MLLGDAILGPITEVGSVACAIGWAAACAACLALSRAHQTITLSTTELLVAALALIVALALALMKLVPLVPGHFTAYEWIALAIWILFGVLISTSKDREKAHPASTSSKQHRSVQAASVPNSPIQTELEKDKNQCS